MALSERPNTSVIMEMSVEGICFVRLNVSSSSSGLDSCCLFYGQQSPDRKCHQGPFSG